MFGFMFQCLSWLELVINRLILYGCVGEFFMEFKTAAVVSCWLCVALIASVYMIVFGNAIGDVLFGVFLPVGLLVMVALILTIYVASMSDKEKD